MSLACFDSQAPVFSVEILLFWKLRRKGLNHGYDIQICGSLDGDDMFSRNPGALVQMEV